VLAGLARAKEDGGKGQNGCQVSELWHRLNFE
jgi:hypothetical protein